jgi:hypothetical protein
MVFSCFPSFRSALREAVQNEESLVASKLDFQRSYLALSDAKHRFIGERHTLNELSADSCQLDPARAAFFMPVPYFPAGAMFRMHATPP